MSKKKTVQLVAISFLVLAVVLCIPATQWNSNTSIVGYISLVLGTVGSVISVFIPSSFTFLFEADAWEYTPHGYKLTIHYKQHGMGSSPRTETFELLGTNYEEVGVDSSHDDRGTVFIKANTQFAGKIIVS